MPPFEGDLSNWERLVTEQNELFRRTLEDNRVMTARIMELQRELLVWKSAHASLMESRLEVERTAEDARHSLEAIQNDNPFVFCIIDGDECLFSSMLLAQGQVGGRQAAHMLTKGILDFIVRDATSAQRRGRPHVLISVYFHKQGVQTKVCPGRCTVQQFESFIIGFNQASEFISVVDVGSGKEAADAKVREHLRIYAKLPQTMKVFLGGALDSSGYTPTLYSLKNEGYLDRVVFIFSGKQVIWSPEIATFLELPEIEVPGLFAAPEQPELRSPRQNQGRVNNEQSRPPCFYHYLTNKCYQGASCVFAHDLHFSDSQKEQLRKDAQKLPCIMVTQVMQARTVLMELAALVVISVLMARNATFSKPVNVDFLLACTEQLMSVSERWSAFVDALDSCHTYEDVVSKFDGSTHRIFIISPSVPGYPQAKFPGVVVFSEIYQVTGPVERFAGQIASHGFIVACPSTYHEFEGPEPIPYDVEGTDRGNRYKVEKELVAYDEDATAAIDLLSSLPSCNGRIAATGMCLGGHLAFRCSFDPRVLSAVCFFATDIHSATLAKGGDDTLKKVEQGILTGPGKAELVLIFGKQDTHVPRHGRDLIRKTLEDADVTFSMLEVQAQHAFIRDESSKGRWDAALTQSCFTFMMEVFNRTIGRDLGPREGAVATVEHVC